MPTVSDTYKALMLTVNMLNVVMLSVIILSFAAPIEKLARSNCYFLHDNFRYIYAHNLQPWQNKLAHFENAAWNHACNGHYSLFSWVQKL
jgi:hypothetical protein